ncbi:MAG: hypothetical protein HUK00_05100 [Bacteroidaceae bacterium]|nr:hypothetical protein [Bacteroidaceae bacterium]
MKKKLKSGLESVLDINSNNIWTIDAREVADLWEISRGEEELAGSENKLLNIIRLAFDVVHFNPNDERDAAKYAENKEYSTFHRLRETDGCVAVRKRTIRRITDITYENIKHLSAKQLLELINDNFGGGWDAIPLQIKDIIESSFDVSTTTLPARRLHAKGGTLERKLKDGFEVLEVAKGMWVEAIFVRKKEPLEKMHIQNSVQYDEDGNRIEPEDGENGDQLDLGDESEKEDNNDEETIDETYYGTYIPEADTKSEDEEEELNV